MGSFSLTHLLLIALIFLLFFGPSKLPSLGQALGKAIRGFKEGLSGEDKDSKEAPRPVERLSAHEEEAPESETTTTTSSPRQKDPVDRS